MGQLLIVINTMNIVLISSIVLFYMDVSKILSFILLFFISVGTVILSRWFIQGMAPQQKSIFKLPIFRIVAGLSGILMLGALLYYREWELLFFLFLAIGYIYSKIKKYNKMKQEEL